MDEAAAGHLGSRTPQTAHEFDLIGNSHDEHGHTDEHERQSEIASCVTIEDYSDSFEPCENLIDREAEHDQIKPGSDHRHQCSLCAQSRALKCHSGAASGQLNADVFR